MKFSLDMYVLTKTHVDEDLEELLAVEVFGYTHNEYVAAKWREQGIDYITRNVREVVYDNGQFKLISVI